MFDAKTTIGTNTPADWVLTVTRLFNATLPLQADSLSADETPVSSAAAQILAGSLYKLLEQPHALYSTHRDLLTASRDFQGRVLSVATERSEGGLRTSEYAVAWRAEDSHVTVWKRNAPATNQFLKLDLGVESSNDRIARGAATVTMARGAVQGASFVAETVRSLSVNASTTLRQLVESINGANAGVTAALSGKYLLLTGDSPGAGNAFQVLTSGAISRAWNFDPALYQTQGVSAAVLYRPASDAVNGGTPPDGYHTRGHGGASSAAQILADAVNDLLDTVAKTDQAGLVTLADPLLGDIGRTLQSTFTSGGTYGAGSLTPWALGFDFGADGLTFDGVRHLKQYAADPAGTRSAIDDLAATLAGRMNTPVDSLQSYLEKLREGVLLGVDEALRNGKSLAEAITAYAETLMLGGQKRQ